MKVKFEIEISESIFDAITENGVDVNKVVDFGEIFKGVKSHVISWKKDLDIKPIYGTQSTAIGISYGDVTGELGLIQVDWKDKIPKGIRFIKQN